jgi:hypothetical protein
MPWYYAGPEAKPVGPVSLEELQARRISGVILPETYIIEDTGQPDPSRTWKRYRDVFPTASASLPPVPPTVSYVPPTPPAVPSAAVNPPPPPIAPPTPAAAAHPLFPSAGAPGHHPVFTTPHGPDPYYTSQKVHSWCVWSLLLGVASPFLIPFCLLGTIMALVSIVMGVGGLIKLQSHRDQSGRPHAIAGILVSLLTLVITVVLLGAIAWPVIKAHEQITTEQTSNDSN